MLVSVTIVCMNPRAFTFILFLLFQSPSVSDTIRCVRAHVQLQHFAHVQYYVMHLIHFDDVDVQ